MRTTFQTYLKKRWVNHLQTIAEVPNKKHKKSIDAQKNNCRQMKTPRHLQKLKIKRSPATDERLALSCFLCLDEHILYEYSVPSRWIIHKHMCYSSHDFAILQDGRAAHDCCQYGTTNYWAKTAPSPGCSPNCSQNVQQKLPRPQTVQTSPNCSKLFETTNLV